MASVSNEQGRRAIQFVGADDKRHCERRLKSGAGGVGRI